MSIKSIVCKVIEKAQETAEEKGNGQLIGAVDSAEAIAMIEMWDNDLDLEVKITDALLELLLAQANSPVH